MRVKDVLGNNVDLKIGDRVKAIGYTKNDLGVGYVRSIVDRPDDPRSYAKRQAYVYWTKLCQVGGGWTSTDLVKD